MRPCRTRLASCANQLNMLAAAQATGRMRKNVAYFKVNYGIVAVSTTALVRGAEPCSGWAVQHVGTTWNHCCSILAQCAGAARCSWQDQRLLTVLENASSWSAAWSAATSYCSCGRCLAM